MKRKTDLDENYFEQSISFLIPVFYFPNHSLRNPIVVGWKCLAVTYCKSSLEIYLWSMQINYQKFPSSFSKCNNWFTLKLCIEDLCIIM